MNLRTIVIPVTALITVGCKRPPEAPQELEELCTYLFAHMRDEDPAALQAGTANLDEWMVDNLEATKEGYVIDNLPQETVDNLDSRDRTLEGLVGASIASEIAHSPVKVARALVKDDPTKIYPDTYTTYDRTYGTDLDCFTDQSCDWLELEAYTVSAYPMSLEVRSTMIGEYRWIELENGEQALLQRTWLKDEADVSLDWLKVPSQFLMTANIPQSNGGTLRVQATWIVAQMGDGAVPENYALNMVIDSMKESDAQLEDWLD